VVDVLFVCTGNLCRSPSAERFLTRLLAQAGVEDVTVESAGIVGASIGVPDLLVVEAATYGLDLRHHVPRRVDHDTLVRADLVIGMARYHAREIVLAEPGAFARTFTLRDLVRRAEKDGPRMEGTLADWLGSIGAGRRHLDLVGDLPVDDIPDPIGGNAEVYRGMLAEVAALTDVLRRLAWPATG